MTAVRFSVKTIPCPLYGSQFRDFMVVTVQVPDSSEPDGCCRPIEVDNDTACMECGRTLQDDQVVLSSVHGFVHNNCNNPCA